MSQTGNGNTVATESSNSGGAKISLASAVLMGLGGMIGAGIFVLLGEAGAVAGSAVWLSFLVAGTIALLTGYSYGKLGARYPSAGGVVEYLTQGYGVGLFSGGMAVLFYLAQVISVAMLAVSFGTYGAPLLFGADASPALTKILGSVLVVAIVGVNFVGARTVTKAESLVVGINVVILLIFTVPALTQVEAHLIAPSTYPAPTLILSSLAFTFFAFTGFGVIANTAGDIQNPQKNLPKAMMLSIGIVMVLYIAVAVAVYGTLPVDKVIAAKNTALAVAAQPILGHAGFVLVSLSAMMATASAINAAFYGTTNQTYLLAKNGELPQGFSRNVWKQGTEGLLITAGLALLLANTLNLTAIASLASITLLLVYFFVNVGHLRLTPKTGARRVIIVVAVLSCFATLAMFVVHVVSTAPQTAVALLAFIAVAFVGEFALQKLRGRTIRPRNPS